MLLNYPYLVELRSYLKGLFLFGVEQEETERSAQSQLDCVASRVLLRGCGSPIAVALSTIANYTVYRTTHMSLD